MRRIVMFFMRRRFKRLSFGQLSYILFISINAFLFIYYCNRKGFICYQNLTNSVDTDSTVPPLRLWGRSYYSKVLHENYERKNDEWRLSSRDDFKEDSAVLDCSALQKVDSLQYIAAGWTKTTYKIHFTNHTLSLKIVNIAGRDVSSCLQQYDKNLYDCFLMAAAKLLHEIVILSTISHPNIVKVLGYCVPNEPNIENPLHAVAIFEEYGEPINVIKMLQLSWEDRLRISLGLSRLLKHLSSFKDPIALNDLRRQQFILVDGEPKLVDVDDVGLHEPKCLRAPCCFNASSNKSVCIPCVKGVCHGYNEKLNILKIGNHFVKHILPHAAPSTLSAVALKIATAYELGSWSSGDILIEIENLTALFKSGKYRRNLSTFLSDFKEFKQRDISSDHDYRCHLTVSGYGCIISVIDIEEAAEMCLSEPQCKAFVLTSDVTWTGRRLVHLKSGVGDLIINNATVVYVK